MTKPFVKDLDMLWELIKDRLWVMEKTYMGTTEIRLQEMAANIKDIHEMLEVTLEE